MVVVPEPAVKCLCAFVAGAVDGAVGVVSRRLRASGDDSQGPVGAISVWATGRRSCSSPHRQAKRASWVSACTPAPYPIHQGNGPFGPPEPQSLSRAKTAAIPALA